MRRAAAGPQDNKTGDVWHVALPRLDPSLLYGYRVFGANEEVHEESEGQRHDPVSARWRRGSGRAGRGRARQCKWRRRRRRPLLRTAAPCC